jgi:hypothetical protein
MNINEERMESKRSVQDPVHGYSAYRVHPSKTNAANICLAVSFEPYVWKIVDTCVFFISLCAIFNNYP